MVSHVGLLPLHRLGARQSKKKQTCFPSQKCKGCLVCFDSWANAMNLSWVDPMKSMWHISIALCGRGAPECERARKQSGSGTSLWFYSFLFHVWRGLVDEQVFWRFGLLAHPFCVRSGLPGRARYFQKVCLTVNITKLYICWWFELTPFKSVLEGTYRDTVSEPPIFPKKAVSLRRNGLQKNGFLRKLMNLCLSR